MIQCWTDLWTPGGEQGLFVVGRLTSKKHAGVSQGLIYSDNCTCCHTEAEVTDETFYLTKSQYPDTGPTSPNADSKTPGEWQCSHCSANFEVTGMTRPGKIPAAQTGIAPQIFRFRGGRLNHCAKEAVENGASATALQHTLLCAAFLTAPHDVQAVLISFMIERLNVFYGSPTLLFPCVWKSQVPSIPFPTNGFSGVALDVPRSCPRSVT